MRRTFRRAGRLTSLLAVAAAVPSAAQGRPIGELRVLGAAGWAGQVDRNPGYTPAVVPGDALAGGVASFSFIYRGFSAGPEVFRLFGSDRRVGSLGASMRLTAGAGTLRPHVVVGAGWYYWDLRQGGSPGFWGSDITPQFSGSAGAGITLGPPGARAAFTAEGRIHRSLQGREFEEHRALSMLLTGVRIAW